MSSEWPRYKAHATVWAAPIVSIEVFDDGTKHFYVQPDPEAPRERFHVPNKSGRERAAVDDYAIIHEGGTRSVCTKHTFLRGFAPIANTTEEKTPPHLRTYTLSERHAKRLVDMVESHLVGGPMPLERRARLLADVDKLANEMLSDVGL
jgi:hypothetical protein